MTGRVAFGGVLLLGLLALPPDAVAISEQEARDQIAEAFDVDVLRVEPGEVDGQPVWMLTVMKAGGDRNDAFQVTRLAVDRESGELVPSFHHGATGYKLPTTPAAGIETRRPDVMRSGTWR